MSNLHPIITSLHPCIINLHRATMMRGLTWCTSGRTAVVPMAMGVGTVIGVGTEMAMGMAAVTAEISRQRGALPRCGNAYGTPAGHASATQLLLARLHDGRFALPPLAVLPALAVARPGPPCPLLPKLSHWNTASTSSAISLPRMA